MNLKSQLTTAVNAEERLDVVDESDRVVGSARRDEIHRRGLRHRSVHIVVFNSAAELFVQRRSLDKDCAPGLWDTSAAGHVDCGERYMDAAMRELSEELGLRSTTLHEVGRHRASERTGQEFVRVYACVSDAWLTLEPTEIIDGRWLNRAALQQWMIKNPNEFTTIFTDICASLSWPG